MMNAIHMVAHRCEQLWCMAQRAALHCIALHCTELHCIALLLNGLSVAGVGDLAELQHGRTDGAADGAHRDGDRLEGQQTAYQPHAHESAHTHSHWKLQLGLAV